MWLLRDTSVLREIERLLIDVLLQYRPVNHRNNMPYEPLNQLKARPLRIGNLSKKGYRRIVRLRRTGAL